MSKIMKTRCAQSGFGADLTPATAEVVGFHRSAPPRGKDKAMIFPVRPGFAAFSELPSLGEARRAAPALTPESAACQSGSSAADRCCVHAVFLGDLVSRSRPPSLGRSLRSRRMRSASPNPDTASARWGFAPTRRTGWSSQTGFFLIWRAVTAQVNGFLPSQEPCLWCDDGNRSLRSSREELVARTRSGVLARVPAGGWPPCWRLFCPALIFSCASCSRISPRRGLFAVAGSTSPRV